LLRSRLHELASHNTVSYVTYRTAPLDYDLRPAKALYSRFEGNMADKYCMTPHGSKFIVNHKAGNTIGAYKTKREAKQNIKDCQRDDLMLEAARDLLEKATDALMRVRHIDRREAHGWIREAAG
jgi:hypothetical protein